MSTQRIVAHTLLDNIQHTTPGGIRREQFVRTRHPIKTALAMLPFVAFVVLAVFAACTRATTPAPGAHATSHTCALPTAAATKDERPC